MLVHLHPANEHPYIVTKNWADSSYTSPYNTSSLSHIQLLSLCCERRTVNMPGEQDKDVCHILTPTKKEGKNSIP